MGAKVAVDLRTGRARDFGFVAFSNREAALAAVSTMNGLLMPHGKKLKVEFRTGTDRVPLPGVGGGGAGGGGDGASGSSSSPTAGDATTAAAAAASSSAAATPGATAAGEEPSEAAGAASPAAGGR
jgi:hypothetical protein